MADRLAATGILLVGGASERFGSPKALATIAGETLAERGWRLLERDVRRGARRRQGADELELPFPVLDDGADERAPVFGVIAGLRAATHDVALVLPGRLPARDARTRCAALVEAGAVPQTGPLPGVYTKAMLPELEARVAGGELALRGVNESVLELDDALLLNVNTRNDLLLAAVADWARATEDVRAVVLVGSYARRDTPADRWSDLDVLLFVDEPGPYADDDAWVARFGEPVLTFLEPTSVGDRVERRVLYETAWTSTSRCSRRRRRGSSRRCPSVGDGPLARLPRAPRRDRDRETCSRAPRSAGAQELPDAAAFAQLASDFWYHALWTAKKLRRGEVFTAISCLDGYVKCAARDAARVARPCRRPVGRHVARRPLPRALGGSRSAGRARARIRALRRPRRRARAVGDDRPLPGPRGGDGRRASASRSSSTTPDLRRRIAEVVPDPRPASTLWP